MSWSLMVFIGLNFVAALSGAIFKPDAWFRQLQKPSWQPPDWAFPLAWTFLYGANAFSGWLVWKSAGFSSIGLAAMALYAFSLMVNASWSAVFFGAKRLGGAIISAALLWLTVAAQLALFWPINRAAALMIIPYLAWVTVATLLSRSIWQLNPDQRTPAQAA
ncbi:MAG: TspO/MBR family protein [Pseudomonadota bacterium]